MIQYLFVFLIVLNQVAGYVHAGGTRDPLSCWFKVIIMFQLPIVGMVAKGMQQLIHPLYVCSLNYAIDNANTDHSIIALIAYLHESGIASISFMVLLFAKY